MTGRRTRIATVAFALAALGFACTPKKEGPGAPGAASTTTDTNSGETSSCSGLRLQGTAPKSDAGKGTISFHLSQDDVDPCSVNGYVVGHPDLTAQSAGGGDYVITNVPPGNHDVILQGQASSDRVNDPTASTPEDIGGTNLSLPGAKVGIRVNAVAAAADATTALPDTTKLLDVGNVSGVARLEGQAKHNGILVVIPGTSFSATTADDGKYTMSNVVPGDHDLDVSKDQYFPVRIGAVTVEPTKTTHMDDVLLRLNRGETGPIVAAAADVPASGDLTYEFTLIPSGSPVKMKMAFEADCPNVSYTTFNSSGKVTLPATDAIKKGGYGTVDLYICLADRDNTASTLKQTITVDLFGNHGDPTFTMPEKISRAYGPVVHLSDVVTTATAGNMRAFVVTSLADEAAALAVPGNFNLQSTKIASSMDVTLNTSDTVCGNFWVYFGFVSPEGYESHVARKQVNYECWHEVSLTGRPSLRNTSADVKWGGDRLYVFGDTVFHSATFYDPRTSTWTAMSATGRPTFVDYPFMRWTGSDLLVLGGDDANGEVFTGALYHPTTDTWTATATAPAAFLAGRTEPRYIWARDRAILYSGLDTTNDDPLAGGAVYVPATDSWYMMSPVGAPSARENALTVWVDSRFVVWSGEDADGNTLNDGGVYDPIANTWTAIASSGAPAGETGLGWATIGTGTSSRLVMLGDGPTADLYDPIANTWSTVPAPPFDTYFDQRRDGRVFGTSEAALVWHGPNLDAPARLNAPNGVPSAWVSLEPSGCPIDSSDSGYYQTGLVAGAMVVWPFICTQKYGYYDLKTASWNKLPNGVPQPVEGYSDLLVADAGGRALLFETPKNSEAATAVIVPVNRSPLTIAWLRPGDRATTGVRPGETVGLGYRILNDHGAVKGGTMKIKSVGTGVTVSKATAAMPVIGSDAAVDVVAADSVAITVDGAAAYGTSVEIVLTYTTTEGYTGDATFQLPIARPYLAATRSSVFGLGNGISGNLSVDITNTGTVDATLTGLTATPGTCLSAITAPTLTSLAAGASVTKSIAVTVASSGCSAGTTAIGTLNATYTTAAKTFTQSFPVTFVVGAFQETKSDTNTATLNAGTPTVTRNLTFTSTGRVANVHGDAGILLTIVMTHSSWSYSQIDVTAPSGTSVSLYPEYYKPDLADGASQTLVYRLDSPSHLDDLAGESVNGTWRIDVQTDPTETGTLSSVTLRLSGTP